jgi:hypothetical protein
MPQPVFADTVGVGPDAGNRVYIGEGPFLNCYVGISGTPCSNGDWSEVPVGMAVQTGSSGTLPAAAVVCRAQAFGISVVPGASQAPTPVTVPPVVVTLPSGTVFSEPGITETIPGGTVSPIDVLTSAGGLCAVTPGWSGDSTPTVTVTVCDLLYEQGRMPWPSPGSGSLVGWGPVYNSGSCSSSTSSLSATAGFSLRNRTAVDPAGTAIPCRSGSVCGYTTGLYAEEAWVSVAIDGVVVTARDVAPLPVQGMGLPHLPVNGDQAPNAVWGQYALCGWCQGAWQGYGMSDSPIAYDTAHFFV